MTPSRIEPATCSTAPWPLCHRGPILKYGRDNIQKTLQLSSESPSDSRTSPLRRSCEDRRTNDGRQADIITNKLRPDAVFDTKGTDHGLTDENQIFPSSIWSNSFISYSFIPSASCAYSTAGLLTKELAITVVRSGQAQRLDGARATVPRSVIVITVTGRQNMPSGAGDQPRQGLTACSSPINRN